MLKIFTLGEYKLFYKNKELKFKYKRTIGLLIYLLLHRKFFSRDAIISIFWDDINIQKALKDLSRHIYLIREKVPSKILDFVHKKDTLSLDVSDKIWIDVFEFEDACFKVEQAPEKDKINILRKIINIYRGNFLENFYVKRAEEFNEWLSLKQDELKNKFTNILNKYCLHYLDKKEYKLAIEFAGESLKREPLQEDMHQKLMYLYNADGQRNLSIKQYEICKNIFAREELALSEEIERLYREIKGNKLPEEELKVPAPKNLPVSLLQEEKSIHLLGRNKEFDFLVHKIENIEQIDKRIIFVTGPSGIGKTRLVLDALRKFTDKYYVLYGSSYQFQGSVSFHPFIKAFKDFFQNINYKIPVKGIWLSNLLKLFPELEDKLNFVHTPVASHRDLRVQLFESFQKLLTNLSENHPVVVFIDNWQWADGASMELLNYMGQNIQNFPILFLINLQSDELKESKLFNEYMLNFKKDERGEILTLKSITKENLLPLFKESKIENKTIADYLHRQSLGNPLLLNEILKFLSGNNKIKICPDGKVEFFFKNSDELPKEILTLKMKDFIERHLQSLTVDARTLIDVASVLEEDFDIYILEKVCNNPPGEIINYIEELLRNRFLKEQTIQNKIRYSFIHGKIRDYIYISLTQTKKTGLHQAIAELLEKDFKDNPEFYSKIAFHHEKALKMKEALRYYELAAEHADSIYQYKEAFYYYKKLVENAEDEIDLARLNLKMAVMLINLGEYSTAIDILNRMQAQADKASLLIEILEWKIFIFYYTLQHELKKEILNCLKKLTGLNLEKTEKLKINYLYLMLLLRGSTNVKILIQKINSDLAVLPKTSMSRKEKLYYKAHYCHFLSLAYLQQGNYRKASHFINKTISLDKKLNYLHDLCVLYYRLGHYFMETEDYKKTVYYINKTKTISEKIKSTHYDLLAYNNLLIIFYIRQKDFQRAYYYLDKSKNMLNPNNKFLLIKNKSLFAEYFLAKSNINEAKEYFKEYVELLKNSEFPLEKINRGVLEAKILSRKKNLSTTDIIKTENLFLKAIADYKQIGSICSLANIQYELAMLEKSINKTEKHKKYLKEALKNYKIIGNRKKIKQINFLLALKK